MIALRLTAPALRQALLAAVALGGLAIAALPAQAASLEDVLRRGELRVGADPAAGQPYFARSAKPIDGAVAYAGFEADLARALAAKLGVKLVFVPTAWPELLAALRDDKFDVALNALEIQACPDVRFTLPYYVASQALLVKKADTRIYSVKDLPGRTVGTTAGSVAAAVLANLPRPAKVKLYADTLGPFKALAAGQVEAVLLESAMVRYQAAQQPTRFRLAGLPMLPRPYGAAVGGTDISLLDGLNRALAAMRAQGELQKLVGGYGLWDTVQNETKPAAGTAHPAKPGVTKPVKPGVPARAASPKRATPKAGH